VSCFRIHCGVVRFYLVLSVGSGLVRDNDQTNRRTARRQPPWEHGPFRATFSSIRACLENRSLSRRMMVAPNQGKQDIYPVAVREVGPRMTSNAAHSFSHNIPSILTYPGIIQTSDRSRTQIFTSTRHLLLSLCLYPRYSDQRTQAEWLSQCLIYPLISSSTRTLSTSQPLEDRQLPRLSLSGKSEQPLSYLPKSPLKTTAALPGHSPGKS